MIRVEVVYALPERQYLFELLVPKGCTAAQALEQCGVKDQFPDVDFTLSGMGIFSKLLDGRGSPVPEDYVMQDHDRLELYRPLRLDPKKARLQRAEKNKEDGRKK